MENNNNNETPQDDNLTEFENQKTPQKKPENTGLQVMLGIFFIGYGIFRLTNTMRGDGAWNSFFGWAMIALGTIRIISVAVKK